MERMTGTGNNHILKGRSFDPNRFLSSVTPADCPINCITIRIASIELITSESLNNKLKTKPDAHNTSSDI